MFLFPPRLPEPAFERLSTRTLRPLFAGFAALSPQPSPRLRLLESPRAGRSGQAHGMPGELQLREEFLSLYGPASLPLPESLETSRLFRALQMSPRFMGEGFRQAAVELFTSPAFVISVYLSVMLYFIAWLAPEPFFSKAFAATLTLRLSLLVGLSELARVAQACLRLYQDSEAARSSQELEAASERFGKAIGGLGLRVLVVVASMGVGRLLPEVPEGGIQALLESSSQAPGVGPVLASVSTATIVADGTLVVTGTAAGTGVASACTGSGLCAKAISPGGGTQLSTRYGPPHTRSNPPHNEAIEEELSPGSRRDTPTC